MSAPEHRQPIPTDSSLTEYMCKRFNARPTADPNIYTCMYNHAFPASRADLLIPCATCAKIAYNTSSIDLVKMIYLAIAGKIVIMPRLLQGQRKGRLMYGCITANPPHPHIFRPAVTFVCRECRIISLRNARMQLFRENFTINPTEMNDIVDTTVGTCLAGHKIIFKTFVDRCRHNRNTVKCPQCQPVIKYYKRSARTSNQSEEYLPYKKSLPTPSIDDDNTSTTEADEEDITILTPNIDSPETIIISASRTRNDHTPKADTIIHKIESVAQLPSLPHPRTTQTFPDSGTIATCLRLSMIYGINCYSLLERQKFITKIISIVGTTSKSAQLIDTVNNDINQYTSIPSMHITRITNMNLSSTYANYLIHQYLDFLYYYQYVLTINPQFQGIIQSHDAIYTHYVILRLIANDPGNSELIPFDEEMLADKSII
jgi:hypothetical protein